MAEWLSLKAAKMSLLCQEKKLFYTRIFEIVEYKFSPSCKIMHYQIEVVV